MTVENGSVSGWIGRIKAGEHDAVQRVWERYFDRLVRLAAGRLKGARTRAADEEDVALNALDSFQRGVAAGRFPKLLDRNDLWQILVMITVRKAADLARHETRAKR